MERRRRLRDRSMETNVETPHATVVACQDNREAASATPASQHRPHPVLCRIRQGRM